MRAYACKVEYLEKARELSEKKAERLLSRMSMQLHAELMQEGYAPDEIMAIQLEIEDEQLSEWRERVAQVRREEQLWMVQNAHLANRASVN